LFALTQAPAGATDAPNPHEIPATAKAILEQAEEFELLSLDPKDWPSVKDGFHGCRVLGKVTITDAKLRQQLVQAFEQGVTEYKGSGVKCNFPRHGIRVTYQGKTVDFLICFQCAHVGIFVDGQQQHLLVGPSPRDAFNKVLAEAKIPLAK
jgi:hypothetical protein